MLGYKLHNGRKALKAYLDRNPIDFKRMDVPLFREWLARELGRKERDATFQKRCEIRDIRKKHRHLLKDLGETRKRKEAGYLASSHRARLEEIDKELVGVQRAIDGLTRAIEASTGEKQQASMEKRDGFIQRLEDLSQEQRELLLASPEKVEFEEADLALLRYKEEVGISQLEEELLALNQQQGKSTRKAGTRFEDVSTAYSKSVIYPQLVKRGDAADASDFRVLSGVTLGVAHTELDNLVVRYQGPEQSVDVLAVVEAKSNSNDVASGFLMRQQNIGFLCGNEEMYEPDAYVTKVYRDGRFGRPAVHKENGESYTFTQESFQRFKVDPKQGYFLDRLYFVVKRRFLNGLSSGEYSRLMYRISTDIHFSLEDDDYMQSLLTWVRGFMKSMQARDVLNIYQKKQAWARQFLLLEPL